jgi:hypothetical protein
MCFPVCVQLPPFEVVCGNDSCVGVDGYKAIEVVNPATVVVVEDAAGVWRALDSASVVSSPSPSPAPAPAAARRLQLNGSQEVEYSVGAYRWPPSRSHVYARLCCPHAHHADGVPAVAVARLHRCPCAVPAIVSWRRHRAWRARRRVLQQAVRRLLVRPTVLGRRERAALWLRQRRHVRTMSGGDALSGGLACVGATR